MTLLARLSLAAALAVAGTAAAAASERHYETMFAEAVTSTYEAQIAGTYPARSEILVRLANRNQYAVPVVPGSDLSVWRQNEVVNVTVTQGLVVTVEKGKGEPGFTYEVLNGTDVLAGIPEDVLVREMTVTTEIKSANRETGAVTFIAPSGYERTAVLADPSLLAEFDVKAGELVSLTYFDAVDIEKR